MIAKKRMLVPVYLMRRIRKQLNAMNRSSAHAASWVFPRSNATTMLIRTIDRVTGNGSKTPAEVYGLKPGTRVKHSMLGGGVVRRWFGLGRQVVVDFDHGGEKELLWDFCKGKLRCVKKKK